MLSDIIQNFMYSLNRLCDEQREFESRGPVESEDEFHYSFKFSEKSDDLFRLMFPDSQMASEFKCREISVLYVHKYVLLFDEEQYVVDNLSQTALKARRVIPDHIHSVGGLENVDICKPLMISAFSDYDRYEHYRREADSQKETRR